MEEEPKQPVQSEVLLSSEEQHALEQAMYVIEHFIEKITSGPISSSELMDLRQIIDTADRVNTDILLRFLSFNTMMGQIHHIVMILTQHCESLEKIHSQAERIVPVTPNHTFIIKTQLEELSELYAQILICKAPIRE